MTGWIDPDDAPEWGDDVFDRAEVRIGDKVVRPASGTLTREGDREGSGTERPQVERDKSRDEPK